LPVGELDLDIHDEVLQPHRPLRYDLEAQKVEDGVLVQGELHLKVDCQCVRCLKSFEYSLDLPDWACLLPLNGDEAVPVVSDSVDLTPTLREDILLELPQHPLCERECGGLPKMSGARAKSKKNTGKNETASSAWAELNKLKL
jgi:uncharacterized metal-binding protein YceD (DUF177 family)